MTTRKKVKVEVTPSGTYRVRKCINGRKYNSSFARKKDAISFRDELEVLSLSLKH
jgi:hypothetical protein